MTLLLDIDVVLIGWEIAKPDDTSGFSDWKLREHKNMRWVSDEQLELIRSSFDDIHWHTTWVQRMINGGNGVDMFTQETGFGPFPMLIDQLEMNESSGWRVAPDRRFVPRHTIPEELHSALDSAGWWKLNAVAAVLAQGGLPGKVVWADDDIAFNLRQISRVLEFFDADDRIAMVAPTDVLTREAIERTSGWLRDGS